MPIPAGYTQLTSGFFRKDSDLSGPYAWNGTAFYLISSGVAGSGTAPDYTQHPSGFWFKTADGSGPYSYDGTTFYLAGNGGPGGTITAATIIATTAFEANAGATFNLYNTPDKTTNYERLRAYFAAGTTARFITGHGGSAASRTLQIGVAGAAGSDTPTVYAQYRAASAPFISLVTPSLSGANTAVELASLIVGGSTSAVSIAADITPTVNQSGTAGATILNVDPTVTAAGSGAYLIQRWGWNGTERARLNSSGILYAQAVAAVASTGIGWSSSLGGTIDLRLVRDAANELALRLGTAAQAFRVYNTYTDASNYERAGVIWSSNVCYVAAQAAGTGTLRQIIFKFTPTTVAGLVAAATAGAGATAMVTDANATTYASIVAGGGANTVPVYSDGTNWRIG